MVAGSDMKLHVSPLNRARLLGNLKVEAYRNAMLAAAQGSKGYLGPIGSGLPSVGEISYNRGAVVSFERYLPPTVEAARALEEKLLVVGLTLDDWLSDEFK